MSRRYAFVNGWRWVGWFLRHGKPVAAFREAWDAYVRGHDGESCQECGRSYPLWHAFEQGRKFEHQWCAAPEVPPRRDGLREALDDIVDRCGKAFAADGVDAAEKVWPAGPVAAYHAWADGQAALARTPEPPDSGDGAEPTTLTFDRVKCGTCGADLSRYSTAATAHVCAANTGSDAVSWSAGFYCARHEAFCQVAHRKQPDREVRLRSGSPAPEGGE